MKCYRCDDDDVKRGAPRSGGALEAKMDRVDWLIVSLIALVSYIGGFFSGLGLMR